MMRNASPSVQQRDTNAGRIYAPQFGVDDDATAWEQIPQSCKCLVIGPNSDVGSVRVKPTNLPEFMLSSGAPLIGESPDLEFHGPIFIKPDVVTVLYPYVLDVLYYKEVPYFLPMKRGPKTVTEVIATTAGPSLISAFINGRRKVRFWCHNGTNKTLNFTFTFDKFARGPVAPVAYGSDGGYTGESVAAGATYAREFDVGDLAQATKLLTGADRLVVSAAVVAGPANGANVIMSIEAID